jgi:hypothetical protein
MEGVSNGKRLQIAASRIAGDCRGDSQFSPASIEGSGGRETIFVAVGLSEPMDGWRISCLDRWHVVGNQIHAVGRRLCGKVGSCPATHNGVATR